MTFRQARLRLGALMLFAWFLMAWAVSASAQTAYNPLYQSVPVTPDLQVTASATADFAFAGPPSRWVAIKNDCSLPLYFDLRGGKYTGTKPATSFGLRLGPQETFTMPIQLYSLGASPAAGNGITCTFTGIAGH